MMISIIITIIEIPAISIRIIIIMTIAIGNSISNHNCDGDKHSYYYNDYIGDNSRTLKREHWKNNKC